MLIAMHNNQEVRDTVGRLLSLLRNEKTSFVIGFANLPFMSNKDYLPPISMLQGYMVQHMKRMEVPCLIEVVHFQKVPHIILQRT